MNRQNGLIKCQNWRRKTPAFNLIKATSADKLLFNKETSTLYIVIRLWRWEHDSVRFREQVLISSNIDNKPLFKYKLIFKEITNSWGITIILKGSNVTVTNAYTKLSERSNLSQFHFSLSYFSWQKLPV